MNFVALLTESLARLNGPANELLSATSQAARKLAFMRKRATRPPGPDRRKWTGFVFNRKRAWVEQPVEMPDKSTGWIKQAQAGYVCVRTTKMNPQGGARHVYLDSIELKPYRNPEAVLLGRMKRGVKEVASAVKAATSRANGTLPPKPGSRRRGRPTTSQ
jgi:hypothetical protein